MYNHCKMILLIHHIIPMLFYKSPQHRHSQHCRISNIKVIDVIIIVVVIIIVDVIVNVIVIVIDVIIIFDVIANASLSSPGEDSCARPNFRPQRFPSFQQMRKLSDPGLEVILTTDSCPI